MHLCAPARALCAPPSAARHKPPFPRASADMVVNLAVAAYIIGTVTMLTTKGDDQRQL